MQERKHTSESGYLPRVTLLGVAPGVERPVAAGGGFGVVAVGALLAIFLLDDGVLAAGGLFLVEVDLVAGVPGATFGTDAVLEGVPEAICRGVSDVFDGVPAAIFR
jgi:hypothetical protein